MFKKKTGEKRASTYIRDRIIIVMVTLLSMAVFVSVDAFELVWIMTQTGETMEMDEVVLTLVVLSLALIWYSRRRQKELIRSLEKQKKLEHDLLELNVTLEKKVVHRTFELTKTNQTLQQEMKLRKEVEEKKIQGEKFKSIVEMAGTICHEFSQPLQSISGNVELLLMSIHHDPALIDKLSTIKAQVERMGGIIKKLLNLTDYRTKPYPGNKTIVDID